MRERRDGMNQPLELFCLEMKGKYSTLIKINFNLILITL